MAEELKSLVIKVASSVQPQGAKHNWSSMTAIFPTFTKKIITPAIGEDKDGKSKGNIGAVVSGMPSVFARANLFKNALDNVTDDQKKEAGLLSFYNLLLDEWRGLISAIALNYDDIQIKRIQLTYSDGNTINQTQNIYEPKGAFGNVLFERKPIWCDQSTPLGSIKTPFIDVILYKGKVVGGTSPDSFVFTSVSYSVADDEKPFINKQTKKFTDPLQSNISAKELKDLYSYVSHISNNIEKFRKNFDGVEDILKPNYSNNIGNLQSWLKDIQGQALNKGISLDEQIPEVSCFKAPFSILFNYSTELYGSEGMIYTEDAKDRIIFDPKDLLLDPLKCEIANIDCGEEVKNFLADRSIYLLRAEVKDEEGNYSYFALPLSALGLNVFGKNLGSILGLETSVVNSRIFAEYDPTLETLRVTLKLVTQSNREISKTQNYTVARKVIDHKDILIWPNFISKQWNKYFLYSELPHNSSNWQARPMVVNTEDSYLRILTDQYGNPFYLAADGNVVDENIATLKIGYNNTVADVPYKYEIYESVKPFKGLSFSFQGKEGGFVVIKYGNLSGIKNWMDNNTVLKEAALGIDFGSTNTSVAYYSITDQRIQDSFKFKNRRISLFQSDLKNNDEKHAVENEIFFFQNDEISGNSIKSIITLHDSKRIQIKKPQQSINSLMAEAIKGGFPCFEKNLPIEEGTDNRYFLNYPPMQGAEIGVGRVEIVHNMKWSSHELENSHKKAYLSTLLLHVYAQLFEENHFPKTLKWSYPSSMNQSLISEYNQIWSTLGSINPLEGESYDMEVFTNSGTLFKQVENVFTSEKDSSYSAWGENENSVLVDNGGWGQATETPPKLGWDTNTMASLEEIIINQEPFKFQFINLQGNSALTEACAVANYLANTNSIGNDRNNLTLCFDIGGSTTDISALCQMMGPNGPGLAMVKQSSIRFAAQRISQATKYSKNFRSVLVTMLERKGITIQGINKGENKYNASTAPYYFEQLVDRLEGEEFKEFYKLLEANCKDLICVNLYVTGLIMYYAGQLSYKLKKEIDLSPDKIPGIELWKPQINIVFTGKGARIFDWFTAINESASQQYYLNQFIKGFGGIQKAKEELSAPPNINPLFGLDDLKYEVSKGLAFPTQRLYVPQNNTAIELIGEENFQLLQKDGKWTVLSADTSVTGQMFQNIESYFISSPLDENKPCPKFMEFANDFFNVSTQFFQLPLSKSDFMEGFKKMNICSYIKNLPEFRQAQNKKTDNGNFDFSAPIIILEGMKFLEEVLLKKMNEK